MKKTLITLTLILAFFALQAQKKSIVGLWNIAEENMIIEFTETKIGKYGSEQIEYLKYKIEGNEIIVPNQTSAKFKLQGKNTLILTDGDEKLVAKRIIPGKNKMLINGIYYAIIENEYNYFNIKDGNDAEFGIKRESFPIKYLTVGSKLLMVKDGRYLTCEIKNDKTFQCLDYEFEYAVFEWISHEEFEEKMARLRLLAEIEDYYYDNNFEAAIEMAKKAIELYPNDEDFYQTLSYVYQKQDNHEEAINILNQFLKIDPQSVSTYGNLSYYYLFIKDYKKAEHAALKALSIDDTQLWIKANLATAMLFQDQYEDARTIFLELKDEWCFEKSYRTCADAWLSDFEELEKAGVIPESQKENVKKLRKLLDWDWERRYYTPTLTDEQKEKVVEVVKIWVDEMFKAENVNRIMQASDVPFAYNRTRVITTTDDLKKLYLETFEEKGKRATPMYEVEIWEYTSEVLWGYIPLNFVKVGVTINSENRYDEENVFIVGEDTTIIVCVLIRNNTFKVVGFNYEEVEAWGYEVIEEAIDWDE
jgi:tetratricopeptide (TPR) repeat protein